MKLNLTNNWPHLFFGVWTNLFFLSSNSSTGKQNTATLIVFDRTISKKAAALLLFLLPLPCDIVLLVDHLPGHLIEHASDVPVMLSTALNIT